MKLPEWLASFDVIKLLYPGASSEYASQMLNRIIGREE